MMSSYLLRYTEARIMSFSTEKHVSVNDSLICVEKHIPILEFLSNDNSRLHVFRCVCVCGCMCGVCVFCLSVCVVCEMHFVGSFFVCGGGGRGEKGGGRGRLCVCGVLCVVVVVKARGSCVCAMGSVLCLSASV